MIFYFSHCHWNGINAFLLLLNFQAKNTSTTKMFKKSVRTTGFVYAKIIHQHAKIALSNCICVVVYIVCIIFCLYALFAAAIGVYAPISVGALQTKVTAVVKRLFSILINWSDECNKNPSKRNRTHKFTLPLFKPRPSPLSTCVNCSICIRAIFRVRQTQTPTNQKKMIAIFVGPVVYWWWRRLWSASLFLFIYSFSPSHVQWFIVHVWRTIFMR